MASGEHPTEPFKRAIAAAVRAIARERDLTVEFGGETIAEGDQSITLPQPDRDLDAKEIARLRGTGDALALRRRYHDPALHARRRPAGDAARAIYDAVEQSRVEALGARRLKGVAGNLHAMLDQRCRLRGYDRITEFQDVPLHEAIGFIVRERLTGRPPPHAARRMVDICRPWVDGKAAGRLDELDRVAENQALFTRTLRRLLADLDMAEEEDESDQADEAEAREMNDDSEAQGGEGDAEGEGGDAAGLEGFAADE